MDDKQPFLNEKGGLDDHQSIPVPATSPRSRSRAISWKRGCAYVALALGLRGIFLGLKHRHEADAASWVSAVSTCEWDGKSEGLHSQKHGHGHHGHGHHRSRHGTLNGKRAENIFLKVPNNESAIKTSRQFASQPHMAGTPGDLQTATDLLALLQQELGIVAPPEAPIFPAGSAQSRAATLGIAGLHGPAAWIDVYYPVLNSPLDRSVEILDADGAPVWSADLEEQSDAADPDAERYAEAVPAFHGLSRGGEVQGKLVYANYGRKADYDALDAAGVDLTGKIVITRYGGIFRGLKVKGAQERGAVGVLIYSDPRDDGSVTAQNGYSSYPHGPARNPKSLQRGSVQFLSIYPGDPTTPGYPSYENSTRTAGENIPSIPSLPISWHNAQHLLREIEQDGENRVIKLVNHVDDKVTPIWNVMGVIPGHISDEVVVIGNHRDAWVLGATDPTSGTVSTYEVLRGLSVLLKQGWKPLRTIVVASWDGEEYGLIGSTEWGEDFADWIGKHVVAYLNLDSSVSGSRFTSSASPSLAHVMRGAAQDIPHPTDANRTLWDARGDKGTLFGPVDPGVQALYDEEHGLSTDGVSAAAESRAEVTGVGALGSGSDYTVFLQRIGVASSNGGFASTLSDPVYHYHSVFDSETWQETYGDPGFHRHVAVAKHLGLSLLRLADAIVLPLNTTQYAYDLDTYLNKVEAIASAERLSADFSALRSSIDQLQAASNALDAEKLAAEDELRRVVRKWHKRARKFAKIHAKIRKAFKKLVKKVKKWLRKHRKHHGDEEECKKRCSHMDHVEHMVTHAGEEVTVGRVQDDGPVVLPVGHPTGCKKDKDLHGRPSPDVIAAKHRKLMDQLSQPGRDHHEHGGRHHPYIPRELIKAAKRVRAVNQKLIAFERGFISEGGIKDREWYKHLGVAPGKWLGYGATTFPGLTEALTFEKNVTLAKYEAERLETLIGKLAEAIQV